ncbi:hypothetical protein [Burkholderia cepacia]|uniref:hypothetical protein n=1 Tax=Burkholderia cepacia TaxID=292 RepID=UPI001FF18E06|nr:hypothetical protein [Burkholderia cepacia]
MPLDPIASQEGSFRDTQPARMAAGIAETEGERAGFLAHRMQRAFLLGLIALDCPATARIVRRVRFR